MLNFTIFGSNAKKKKKNKTEYMPDFEIAVHEKTIFRRLYITLFISRVLSNKTNFFISKN